MVGRRKAVLATIRGTIQLLATSGRANRKSPVGAPPSCGQRRRRRRWLASVPPKRHDAGQRESKAGDLGGLQTVLATAWPTTRQRHEQHVPPSSVGGQEQAAENDQKRAHEPHRRKLSAARRTVFAASRRGRGTGAPSPGTKLDFSVRIQRPKRDRGNQKDEGHAA